MKRKGFFLLLSVLVLLLFTAPVHAAKVRLNKKSTSIYVGKTVQLRVAGTKKKITWKSRNKKIATVSKKGKVKGIKAGKTIITAKIGKKVLKCKITVKKKKTNPTTKSILPKENSYIRFRDKTPIKLRGGESITVWVDTSSGIDFNTYASTHFSEYYIDFKVGDWAGNSRPITITAKEAGYPIEAALYVENYYYSSIRDSLDITIYPRLIDMSFRFSGEKFRDNNVIMSAGESLMLQANPEPFSSFLREVTWTSSDENIAVITNSGLESPMTAISRGITTVTAVSETGLKKSFPVKVLDANISFPNFPITMIKSTGQDIVLVKGEVTSKEAVYEPPTGYRDEKRSFHITISLRFFAHEPQGGGYTIRYSLYDENDKLVQNSDIYINSASKTQYDQEYDIPITLYNLQDGNYRIKFTRQY